MSEVQVVEPVEVLVPLGRQEAERLDKRLRLMAGTARENFEKVGRLLDEAKTGRVHEVLGFASWTAYVADAVGGQLHLSRDARQVMVGLLSGQGMSQRGIAETVGASVGTVNADLASQVFNSEHVDSDHSPGYHVHDESPEVAEVSGDGTEDTVTGLDNKTYPKQKPRKPRAKNEPEPAADTPGSAEPEVQTEPEPEPEPEPVKAERKIQIPTALRAEVKMLGLTIDLMGSLTQDPRWEKARHRFTSEDRATLDKHIELLTAIRAAMGELYNTTEVAS